MAYYHLIGIKIGIPYNLLLANLAIVAPKDSSCMGLEKRTAFLITSSPKLHYHHTARLNLCGIAFLNHLHRSHEI